MKLPVPLQMTSWPRYLSPVEVQQSSVLSEVLQRIDLPTNLVILLELRSCHLSFQFAKGVTSYEDARYCSMLIRESPEQYARPGHHLIPLAAAFSPTPAGCSLWEEMWAANGVGRSNILEWFAHYSGIVCACQITPFLRYGFTIEAHQQNAIIELSEKGWLTRLFCREIGGGIEWDLERLEGFPEIDFSSRLYTRADMFVPAQTSRSLLRHTMLESHLLPLASICSSAFDIEMDTLLGVIRSELAAAIESVQPAADDSWSVDQFNTYRALLKFSLLEEAVEANGRTLNFLGASAVSINWGSLLWVSS